MENILTEYENDFYAWLMKNAAFIREGRFSEVDIENVAEESECMGRSEKRELISRLKNYVFLKFWILWKLFRIRLDKYHAAFFYRTVKNC